MTARQYIREWFQDFSEIVSREFRQIFSDGGVLLIFFVAGLVYPLLYNVVYRNGILEDTPIAVVDMADCPQSRRFAREVDATRECRIAYLCTSMEEARRLMEERKVNGIILFPSDFGKKLVSLETATVSVYCDMSSFLYYKNALMGVNHVMLSELGQIQVERYSAAGYTAQEASPLIKAVPYGENNPYNPAFAYNIFLLAAVLLIIVQQTMFYGMTLLAGTMREEKRYYALARDHGTMINGRGALNLDAGRGALRIVFGRGAAYWAIYLGIAFYITLIVPALFGMPQRGSFWDIVLLDLFFVTDCVFFCMSWSTLVRRRETVFVLFLFISPICVFLTGTSWPTTAFPAFWRWFSYLFPSTFGVKAYVNMNTAGGDLSTAGPLFMCMTLQTIIYFAIASISTYVENILLGERD